jgi:hypothetical protein
LGHKRLDNQTRNIPITTPIAGLVAANQNGNVSVQKLSILLLMPLLGGQSEHLDLSLKPGTLFYSRLETWPSSTFAAATSV